MDNLPHWLTDDIAVSGQIDSKSVSSIKQMGFKSIICNRPDYESDTNQPTKTSIEVEARKLGVFFEFLPVASSNHTESEASKMASHLTQLPKPILVYCRTGGRSSALIGLSIQLGFFKP